MTDISASFALWQWQFLKNGNLLEEILLIDIQKDLKMLKELFFQTSIKTCNAPLCDKAKLDYGKFQGMTLLIN